MANLELNCPTKVVQRDGWTECETLFLINCYNHNRDEIGKNKTFKSKKEFFAAVAKSMAGDINSRKTPDQVSSRFYTLTRKPKNSNRESSDVGSIINMNDATVVDASLLEVNKINSVDLNSQMIIDLDASEMSAFNAAVDVKEIRSDTIISAPREPPISVSGTMYEELTPTTSTNESDFVEPFQTKKIESIGMLSAFDRKRNFPRFNESHRSQYSNIGKATVYNRNTENVDAVRSGSCSPDATVTGEIAFNRYLDNTSLTSIDNRMPLRRTASASSPSNCTITSGALNINCETSSDSISDSATALPRITSVLGRVISDQDALSYDDRLSLGRISSASSSSTITSSALNTIHETPSDSMSNYETALPRISSVLGRVTTGQDALSYDDCLSLVGSTESASSSSNCTVTSGALSRLQSQATSSDFVSHCETSSRRITNFAVDQEPFSVISTSKEFPFHIQSTSSVIGRPAIAIHSQSANNFASLGNGVLSVTDRSIRPIIGLPSKKLTSLGSSNTNVDNSSSDDWTKPETEWLLEKYYDNIDEVGPLKQYRTKNEMWESLAESMSVFFPVYRTGDDLSKRVQYIINRKKKAVEHNRRSGLSRVDVEYEELINKIAAVDDSIEPEVLRDANSVYYKKKSKETGQPPNKKPRWDKPNKKAILNTLSETMLAIEKRRAENDKLKDERRKEAHLQMMEIIRSMKNREN